MNCGPIWEGRQWRVLEPQLLLFSKLSKRRFFGCIPSCSEIRNVRVFNLLNLTYETQYILRSLKNKNIYWQKYCYLSSNEAGSEMKYVWINGKVFLCNKFFYKLPLLSWDPGSGLQITVAHRILTNQICQCPMRSHLCLDIMSGEFFCRKSFSGKEEWKSTSGKSYFVLGRSWGHETTMTSLDTMIFLVYTTAIFSPWTARARWTEIAFSHLCLFARQSKAVLLQSQVAPCG